MNTANKNAPRSGDSVKREKEKLSQYRMLIKEIENDRERLTQLAGRLLRANPAGIPDGMAPEVLAGYRDRISENLIRCIEQLECIQAYINTIDDSEMRRIFTLYYINGYPWQKVAFEIGEYDESYPRRKHNAYICKKLDQSNAMSAALVKR